MIPVGHWICSPMVMKLRPSLIVPVEQQLFFPLPSRIPVSQRNIRGDLHAPVLLERSFIKELQRNREAAQRIHHQSLAKGLGKIFHIKVLEHLKYHRR